MHISKISKNDFWKLSAIASIVSICNCFFYSNRTVMYIAVGIEVLWLLSRLTTGKLQEYYSYYVVFMALSLEFPEFVGTDSFYGFKTIDIGPINIGVVMIFPLFIRLLFSAKFRVEKGKCLDHFFKQYSFLALVALFLGLIHWLFNDNGIGESATFSTFFGFVYIHAYIYICFICFYLLIKQKLVNTLWLENTLFSIIVAVGITMLFSFAFSNFGVYGGVRTLQISNLYMALPCCVIIFIYKDVESERRIPVFIASIVISIMSLLYNANGKTVLSLGITLVFVLIILFRRNKLAFGITILAIPAILFLGVQILEQLSSKYFLLSLKVKQAFSLVRFWTPEWLTNISESPQFRIQEFSTVLAEYIRKPWDLLFGKGYMGSTIDNFGYFFGASSTTFSQFELTNHIYINMHETLNHIFLISGVYGLYFYFKYLLRCIKSAPISFWCVIGAFWFGLFFTYSVTIAAFGITALGMAFVMIDNNLEAQKHAD